MQGSDQWSSVHSSLSIVLVVREITPLLWTSERKIDKSLILNIIKKSSWLSGLTSCWVYSSMDQVSSHFQFEVTIVYSRSDEEERQRRYREGSVSSSIGNSAALLANMKSQFRLPHSPSQMQSNFLDSESFNTFPAQFAACHGWGFRNFGIIIEMRFRSPVLHWLCYSRF